MSHHTRLRPDLKRTDTLMSHSKYELSAFHVSESVPGSRPGICDSQQLLGNRRGRKGRGWELQLQGKALYMGKGPSPAAVLRWGGQALGEPQEGWGPRWLLRPGEERTLPLAWQGLEFGRTGKARQRLSWGCIETSLQPRLTLNPEGLF